MGFVGKQMSGGRIGAVMALAFLVAAFTATPAHASESISSFAASQSSTQAGGHPDLSVSFTLAEPGAPEVAESAVIGLPAGLTVVPSSVPSCAAASFALDECPASSQVGLATVRASYEGDADHLMGTAPVYALAPESGRYGGLGFVVPTTEAPVTVPLLLRNASDYGLSATIEDLDQTAPLAGLSMTLWGVPAEVGHDSQRFPRGAPGEPPGCPGLEDASCLGGPVSSSISQRGFTLAPTTCASRHPAATLAVRTYGDPDHLVQAQASLPAPTGCDQLSLNSSLAASPTTAEANSPSGLTLTVADPLSLSPSSPTGSELRNVIVALPPELELNEAALEGRAVCNDAEAGIGTESPGACPEESLLGSVSLELPSGPVPGFGYLGEPAADGSARLLLLASGGGLDAKLAATLGEDPETEQPLVRLEELPQLPISEYEIHLFAGREGLFLTPIYCGEFEVEGRLTPWDEDLPGETPRQNFTIDSGPGGLPCLGPAKDLQVTLSPGSAPADGSSAVTATAAVRDANGLPVPWDELTFSSSDPGDKIGPVQADGDGTYSARIVSSTTPGVATITATDESVEPHISGAGQLTQLSLSQGSPPHPKAAPKVRLTKKPRHASRERRPRFRFRADVSGATFRCRLDHHAFRRCRSPFVSPRLAPGHHRFQVRAASPTGVLGPTVGYSFVVLRHRHRHRRRQRG
jgi:hypothetical protein